MCAKTRIVRTGTVVDIPSQIATQSNSDKLQEKAIALLHNAQNGYRYAKARRNIVNSERLLSAATGAYVLYSGISNIFRNPISSALEIVVGTALVLRGSTGYCPIKEQLTDVRDVSIIIEESTIR